MNGGVKKRFHWMLFVIAPKTTDTSFLTVYELCPINFMK